LSVEEFENIVDINCLDLSLANPPYDNEGDVNGLNFKECAINSILNILISKFPELNLSPQQENHLKEHPNDILFLEHLLETFSPQKEAMHFIEGLNHCELKLLGNPLANGCIAYLINNKNLAESTSSSLVPTGAWLGCKDAYRHAYFNALNTKDCGLIAAKLWGDAHECNNTTNDSKMDLLNNTMGQSISDLDLLSDSEISIRTCNLLVNASLYILDATNIHANIISSSGCSCL